MSEPYALDRATAVEEVGPGLWRATVGPEWNVGSTPNGGLLVTVGLAASARIIPHPDPFAISAHFPSRAQAGSVDIAAEIVRIGKRHSTAVAQLQQGGQNRVHVTATYGDLGDMDGPTNIQADTLHLPSPEACIRAEGPAAPEFMKQFDLRLTPETAGWAVGLPSGVGEVSGWVRLADGRPPDPPSLPLFADAFPPTVFNLMLASWIPTLELTVHVRARPVAGWLQCRFRTRFLMGGYLEGDGELWDESGTLVALSRQLARVHEPQLDQPGPPRLD